MDVSGFVPSRMPEIWRNVVTSDPCRRAFTAPSAKANWMTPGCFELKLRQVMSAGLMPHEATWKPMPIQANEYCRSPVVKLCPNDSPKNRVLLVPSVIADMGVRERLEKM